MSAFLEERVLTVHHWTDRLFSFTTTRDPALRFSNGHFTMIGLKVNDKPLLRAYSIVSANYEEHLDAQKLQVLFVIGTDHAVGTQQRLAIDHQADHGEVAVGKPQPLAAGGGEGKQTIGPVVYGEHTLFKKHHGERAG